MCGHLMALSETWLSSRVNNQQIKLNRFRLFRTGIVSRVGGLSIYVQNNFECNIIDTSVGIEEPIFPIKFTGFLDLVKVITLLPTY